MLYIQTHTHTHKNQALLLFLVLCLPSSSFRPWVPDLNLIKSLEPMSETQCLVLLALKIFFQLSIYSQFFLLSHSRMQTIYNKILKCIIYAQYTASLEPSEVEVRSISLIISKTQFFYCFLFLPGILHFIPFFFKNFFTKT